jgi:hypothetical protein
MEAEAIQQLKNEPQAAFDSKLEVLQGVIATLQKQNEDLLVQKERNSQSKSAASAGINEDAVDPASASGDGEI